jgi:uncharacterized membrane protein YfcA
MDFLRNVLFIFRSRGEMDVDSCHPAVSAVPYLGALNLDKEDMIQALGLSFTISTIALAPALIGMAAGGALRGRFSEQTFRRVFVGGLLVLALTSRRGRCSDAIEARTSNFISR